MNKRNRWFTTKELILETGLLINPTEMIKFTRKLRHLAKAKMIEQRVCTRGIAWRHEFEYKRKTIRNKK